MEEFRPLVADRVALSLVNRHQVTPDSFIVGEGCGIQLIDVTRRAVIAEYQRRKRDEVTHPNLNLCCPVGRQWFLQARILSRVLRGDLAQYVPCVLTN